MMMSRIFRAYCVAACVAAVLCLVAAHEDVEASDPGDFIQLTAQRFYFSDVPQLAAFSVLPVASQDVRMVGPGLTVFTNSSILQIDPSTLQVTSINQKLGISVCPGGMASWLSSSSLIYMDSCSTCLCLSLTSKCMCRKGHAVPIGSVQSLAYLQASDVGMAVTNNGLIWFSLKSANEQIVPLFNATQDVATAVLYVPQAGSFLVGSTGNVYMFSSFFSSQWSWREYVNGVVDASVTSLALDAKGRVWISTTLAVNVLYVLQNAGHTYYVMERLDWQQGLATSSPVTAVASLPFAVLSGGVHGVSMHYLSNAYCEGVYFPLTESPSIKDGSSLPHVDREPCWTYHQGPRWLPDDNVISAVSDAATQTILVRTLTGLSLLTWSPQTFVSKADTMNALTQAHHNRYGLVSDCSIPGTARMGDVSACQLEADVNDGLWTSLYVTSLAFAYKSQPSSSFQQQAMQSLIGMSLLQNATGIKGLMGRSVEKMSIQPAGDAWQVSHTMPGWVWMADASSDEVVGHFFAYSVLGAFSGVIGTSDLAAELAVNIARYIVSNNFYLIDYTGVRTHWGFWNPQEINHTPKCYDQRGINAVQILGWLLVGIKHADNDADRDLLINGFRTLTSDENHYLTNIVNAFITMPEDYNHSDNELLFLAYFTYACGLLNNPYISQLHPLTRDAFLLSIQRSYYFLRNEGDSLYIYMFYAMHDMLGATVPAEFDRVGDLAAARAELARWPMDVVEWPVSNLDRVDLRIDPNLDRSFQKQSAYPFPSDGRSCLFWNCSPYDLTGGSGHSQRAGSPWMLPFWLGRAFGYL
jgi:hypothetical protein